MPSAGRVAWAKFRVAAVALAAAAILGVLVFLLTGGTLLEPKVQLLMYISDATGLASGSPVSVNGVEIGQVSKVELSGSNQPNRVVRVSIEVIERHLPDIPVDSTAEIGTETMIGDKFVDITSGHATSHVRAGSEIQFKPSPDLMKNLDLTQFAQQLRQVDANIRDVQEGRNQLGQFILSEAMYDQVLAGIGSIETAIQGAVKTTGTVGSMLYGDQLYRQLHQSLTNLDQTLAQLQSGQGAGGRMLRDPAQYDEMLNNIGSLRQTIASLQSASFIQSDALYTDLNRSLLSVLASVDRMQQSSMFSSSEMYDNLSGMAHEIATTLSSFRENPKKYLRLKVF